VTGGTNLSRRFGLVFAKRRTETFEAYRLSGRATLFFEAIATPEAMVEQRSGKAAALPADGTRKVKAG